VAFRLAIADAAMTVDRARVSPGDAMSDGADAADFFDFEMMSSRGFSRS